MLTIVSGDIKVYFPDNLINAKNIAIPPAIFHAKHIFTPGNGKNEFASGSSVKKSLSATHLSHVKKGWASWASVYKILAGSGF
jgi:hypothetical protein